MSKQARAQRRSRERVRRAHGDAAAVAERANRSAEILADEVVSTVAALTGQRIRPVRLGLVDQQRQLLLGAGYQWPKWCWIPSAMVGMAVMTSLGYEEPPAGTVDEGLRLGPITVLAGLSAWAQGRIALRFDPDLLAALEATPLTGDLPADALRQIPAWGLYLDCPHLGPDVGVFCYLDPDRIEGPKLPPLDRYVDELVMIIVRPHAFPHVLINRLWFSEGSLEAALAAQHQQNPAPALQANQEAVGRFCGRSFRELLGGIVAMLLYAASTDVDARTIAIEPEHRPPAATRSRSDSGAVTVIEAGYRIGAALRADASAATRVRGEAEPTGKRVSPHLRRAHWHAYWHGPKTHPSQRRLELKWLAPIAVNVDLARQMVTVVRDVRADRG